MNSQEKRIIAGVLVGIAIPTAIYLLLPKTAVVHFAYISLLLAAVVAGATLWRLSKGGKKDYLTNLAFPLSLKSYIALSALMAVVFSTLDVAGVWSIGWSYYAVLYLILLAVTAWRLLAIGAGQEKSQAVGEAVKAQTSGWKMLQADADSILLAAPAELKADITAVRDAIRFSDPMAKPEIAAQDAAIAKDLSELKALASAGKAAEAQSLCAKLQAAIKDRNNRLKMLK